VSEAHHSSDSKKEMSSNLRELPRNLAFLLSNPTFFFLNLAGSTEGLLIAGFAAFLPKLIESQFSVNASLAALLMGKIRPNNYYKFFDYSFKRSGNKT